MSNDRSILVIGAGPAGLTAAYEMLNHDGFNLTIVEKSDQVGGISRTVEFDGRRMDIGGHRFYTQSRWVLNWWSKFLEFPFGEQNSINIYNQNKEFLSHKNVVNKKEYDFINGKMLIQPRKSRIIFNGQLFDYPLNLNFENLKKFGLVKCINYFLSYVSSSLFSVKKPENLEDFFIKNFGRKLYEDFFKEYTEKVWGVDCRKISAEWGQQRIKSLNLFEAIKDYIFKVLKLGKTVNRSLIEQFYYPEKGPGMLWENVLKVCVSKGASFKQNLAPENILLMDDEKFKVTFSDESEEIFDLVISTIPISSLISLLKSNNLTFDNSIEKLSYRNMKVAGVLIDEINSAFNNRKEIDDTWMYVQEPNVKAGRIQFFKNWSKGLLKNEDENWIGVEYFCGDKSDLWKMEEDEFKKIVINDLLNIGLIEKKEDVLDISIVIQPKAYPSYFGSYEDFLKVRDQLLDINNLYLAGRNGLHQYNNQDHSMLTSKFVTECILGKQQNKKEIWDIVNKDQYVEEAIDND